MNKPYSDHPVSTRVRLHRKRRKLLSDLQQLVYSKDSNVALSSLQSLVDAFSKENSEDEKNPVSE